MGFLLCGLPVFWNMAVMEQKWLEKRNALGSQEEYAGTIFLAICIFLLFVGGSYGNYTKHLYRRII